MHRGNRSRVIHRRTNNRDGDNFILSKPADILLHMIDSLNRSNEVGGPISAPIIR
jgi:hypothetical protein